jgi:hypothetical protein
MENENLISAFAGSPQNITAHNPVLPPIYQTEESSEVGIIKNLGPQKVLTDLKMHMMGFDFDERKKIWVKGEEKPLMNEKGINKYLNIMRSVITPLVTFGNYDIDEINRLTLYVCEKAIPKIHINYKDYGVQDKSDLQIIDIQIFNLTLAAFKKAVGAGDRNVVRATTSENVMQRYNEGQDNNMASRPGILARINPFK